MIYCQDELRAELERVSEEKKVEIEDLQKQIENLEKQLKSVKDFLEVLILLTCINNLSIFCSQFT